MVNVEDGFFAYEVDTKIVPADDAGAEVGEEGGGGREVVFPVALVDFGWGLWTVCGWSIPRRD